MSQIPKDIKSKYNQDNKFKWVDSQLEKFMEKQKEDTEYIENLESGVSEMEIKITELESLLEESKENFRRLERLYTFGTPTDGLEVGSPEDYEVDNQLNLFNG